MHSTRLLVVWVTLAALTALNPVQAQEEEGTPRRRRRPVAAPETPETPAEPEAPKPETPRPEAPKPEAPKPEAPKPEAPKPEAPKPEAPKPEAPKVEVPKPEAPKPEAPKVEAPKPGTESGDEEGGARRRPPRGRPTPPKPETPKPEAPKPGAPKPEAPKPEAPKPDAPKAEKLPDAAGNEPAPEVEAAPLSPARDSDFNPTGYVGPYQPDNFDEKQNVVPVPNRWMVPFPEWNRYSGFRGEPDSTGLTYEYPFTRGGILDPYQQNILKGDYPIIGNEIFFAMTLISDTVLESRTAPTPRGIASRDAFAEEFFGNGRQDFLAQTFLASFELFRGDTAFKPRDFEIRATLAYNINVLHLQEFNGVNIDVRDERDRLDSHLGVQELFYEYHIGDLTEEYDFWSVRLGIQGFVSDFRGFLFSDNQPGVRFSGTYFANRLQWNLAGFYFLEKDTNSGLNELPRDIGGGSDRRQQVVVANVIWQDAFKEFLDEELGEGFTLLLSYHFNRDAGGPHFDQNGFNVRPGRFGRLNGAGPTNSHTINAHYLGLAGEGHIGRFNLTFEYFYAFGRDSFNPIAGRSVDISAHMFMAEPSVDFDWLRVKGNFLYQSGDPDPESGKATGFDTIVDNPNFAGSEDSFYQRQSIVLPQTTVLLLNRFSFFNSLRTGKNEGQANFVNPGLILMGGGLDMNITPRLRVEFNANYLLFDRPETTELLVFQRQVARDLGVDYNLGVQYRPLLTDNVIINFGAALFKPLEGFGDLYESRSPLYSCFAELVLVY